MSTCRHTCLYTCLHVDTHVYTHFPTQGEEGEGGVGADEVGRGGEEGQAEEAQGLVRTRTLDRAHNRMFDHCPIEHSVRLFCHCLVVRSHL